VLSLSGKLLWQASLASFSASVSIAKQEGIFLFSLLCSLFAKRSRLRPAWGLPAGGELKARTANCGPPLGAAQFGAPTAPTAPVTRLGRLPAREALPGWSLAAETRLERERDWVRGRERLGQPKSRTKEESRVEEESRAKRERAALRDMDRHACTSLRGATLGPAAKPREIYELRARAEHEPNVEQRASSARQLKQTRSLLTTHCSVLSALTCRPARQRLRAARLPPRLPFGRLLGAKGQWLPAGWRASELASWAPMRAALRAGGTQPAGELGRPRAHTHRPEVRPVCLSVCLGQRQQSAGDERGRRQLGLFAQLARSSREQGRRRLACGRLA